MIAYTQLIEARGHSIRVSTKPGAPDRTPLVIFNGIGAPLDLLSPLVEALHHADPLTTVITFDYPGVGMSSTPRIPYRFSGLAQTVAHMLDKLGHSRVNIMGLSWGGFLAQQFAYDYPGRCNRLILAATCAGVASVPPSPRVLAIMASPRRYTDPEYAESVAPIIYGGRFRTDPSLAAHHAQQVAERPKGSTRGYAYQVAAVYWWTSLHWLHTLRVPTLVLAGDDDPLIPLINMRTIARLIPGAKLHTFEDGHLFLLTSKDRAVPVIRDFLGVEQ